MAELPANSVEVLAGEVGGGLRWVVVASNDDGDLYTMLHIYRGDRQVAGSGWRAEAVPAVLW